MNLNKFTKAELIHKLKSVKNTTNVENKIQLVEIFFFLKKWLLTLSLVALLVRIFKKYTLIHKTLRICSWILWTIFGISVIDHFNLAIFISSIKQFFGNIIFFLTDSSLYKSLSAIFGGAQVTREATGKGNSSISWGSPKTKGNEENIRWSEKDSKILDWLKENEVKKEESNNKKYLLLLLLLLGSGGVYYYFPEIKDYLTPNSIKSIFAWTSAVKTWFHDLKWVSRDVNTSVNEIKKASNILDFLPNPNKKYKNFEEEAEALLFKLNRFMSVWNDKDVMSRDVCYTVHKALDKWIDNLNHDYSRQFVIFLDNTSNKATINNFWDVKERMDEFWDSIEVKDLEPEIEEPENKEKSHVDNTIFELAEAQSKKEQEEWETATQSSNNPATQFFKKMKRKLTSKAEEIKYVDNKTAPEPPMPPAPPAPPTTESGAPSGLLDQIRKGKSLRKTETIEKGGDRTGQVLGEESSSSKIDNIVEPKPMNILEQIRQGKKLKHVETREKTPVESNLRERTREPSIMESLSKRFDEIKAAVTGDDDIDIDLADTQSVWSDNGNTEKQKPSIVVTPVESNTPSNRKSPFFERAASLLGLSPKASLKDLHDSYDKGKGKATDLEQLVLKWNEEVKSGDALTDNQIRSQTKDLSLTEIFEVTAESNVISEDQKDFLRRIHVIADIDKITIENPGITKIKMIELLTKEHPTRKDEILDVFSKCYDDNEKQISDQLSGKKLKRFKSRLLQSDLDDYSDLQGNVTEDRIKTLKRVNKSHASLLDEIKQSNLHALNKNIYSVESEMDESFSTTMPNEKDLFTDTQSEFDYKADVQCFNRNGERTIELKLPVLDHNMENLVIRTNDNHIRTIRLNKESFVPNKTITIVWSDLIPLDKLDFTTDIYELCLQDAESNLHRIYVNTAVLINKK